MIRTYRWALALALSGLGACAGTAPKATFQHALAVESRVGANDHLQVTVDAAPGVTLMDFEKTRLSEEIKTALDRKRALNASNSGDPRDLEVNLSVTRYQKGNAFARAMLAGLGQIHIDGHVKLTKRSDHSLLSEFNIAKTFAWGGIYGSSTSMEDIERTFADGVAASLTGQAEEKNSSAKPKS